MQQYLLTNAPIVRPSGIEPGPLLVQGRHFIAKNKVKPGVQEIDCTGYALFPGFINAHDHLELNHYPRTRYQSQYNNAHEWGEDVSRHLETEPFQQLRAHSLQQQCWVGGMKNLLCGVTTVAHHNPLHHPLRQRQFPIDVVRRYTWAHSLHFSDTATIKKAIQRATPSRPFIIHLAEGTDTIATKEFHQLQDFGGIGSTTILIHGVGMSDKDQVHGAMTCAGLVWCPSSNQFLLGKTAQIWPWLAREKVALGSDSRLTAAGDLLDECRVAYETNQLGLEALLRTITSWPARMLGLSQRGDLAEGFRADIVALPLHTNPLEALIKSRRYHIGLVMTAGTPCYGQPPLLHQVSRIAFDHITVDEHAYLLHHQLFRQLQHHTLLESGLMI